MTDEGLGPVELTSRWVGFYRHRWEQLGTYPIVANLVQTGKKIKGEMYDQITDRSDYLTDMVEIFGKNISAERQHELRVWIRLFGQESVRHSHLPDTSDIKGRIRGNRVEFKKTYRGAWEVTCTTLESQVSYSRREKHKVHYAGHLDVERMCLAGRWLIR